MVHFIHLTAIPSTDGKRAALTAINLQVEARSLVIDILNISKWMCPQLNANIGSDNGVVPKLIKMPVAMWHH